MPTFAVAAASLDIHRGNNTLQISGATSSSAHEEILRELATAMYPDSAQEWAVSIDATTPPGWSLVTEQALRTLVLVRHGNALVTPQQVRLQGVHDDPAGWRQAIAALQRNLLPGMQIRDEAIVFDDRLSFAELCQQQFGAALARGPVRFALASSDLSPASYPLLDALVEIAADCPATRIRVTGHTDASGNEALNLQLSTARAAAVIRYMAAHGIAPERLTARGAGSADPLDPASTPAARARNRRIEFQLEQD